MRCLKDIAETTAKQANYFFIQPVNFKADIFKSTTFIRCFHMFSHK